MASKSGALNYMLGLLARAHIDATDDAKHQSALHRNTEHDHSMFPLPAWLARAQHSAATSHALNCEWQQPHLDLPVHLDLQAGQDHYGINCCIPFSVRTSSAERRQSSLSVTCASAFTASFLTQAFSSSRHTATAAMVLWSPLSAICASAFNAPNLT